MHKLVEFFARGPARFAFALTRQLRRECFVYVDRIIDKIFYAVCKYSYCGRNFSYQTFAAGIKMDSCNSNSIHYHSYFRIKFYYKFPRGMKLVSEALS